MTNINAELSIGDIVTSENATLKGIVWRVERKTGVEVYIKAAFGTFEAKKRKAGRWTCEPLKKLDIITLAQEYARFGEFVRQEAKRLGIEFNAERDQGPPSK